MLRAPFLVGIKVNGYIVFTGIYVMSYLPRDDREIQKQHYRYKAFAFLRIKGDGLSGIPKD